MSLSLQERSADLSPPERHCPQCQALVPQEITSCPQCGFIFPGEAGVPPIQPGASDSFGTLPPLDASASVKDVPILDALTEESSATPVPPAEMPAAIFGVPSPPGIPPDSAVAPPESVSIPPKRKINMKLLLIALAVVVVLSTGGGLAYLLTRPHPAISVRSETASGSPLTGSPDAILHISGHDFTANSTIVFLLDGKAAPDAHNAQSDANGMMKADIAITDNWTFATHVLTAKDASGYATKEGVPIKVIPAPVLTGASPYHAGTTLAASQATVFHISGKRFAPNASITLLLDGATLAGVAPITSDSKGRFELDIAPSSAWTLGAHLLTAKDSQGYTTKTEMPLMIVPEGQADTPGPNGAPADDQTFSLTITVQAHNTQGAQLTPFTVYLTITGQPDPAGGKPCDTGYDDGQPHTYTGKESNGQTYTDTETFTCTGSYKGGKLIYIEMLTSEHAVLSDGDVCGASNTNVPIVRMDGTFTNSTTATGTYTTYHILFTCTSGTTWEFSPITGTWTGTT